MVSFTVNISSFRIIPVFKSGIKTFELDDDDDDDDDDNDDKDDILFFYNLKKFFFLIEI